ncbi:hypothetical protein EDD21DRAFT_379341 [Dissophora ornata]|nr:hypothetical protein EDD21DRAFT_379341 [Dissophora ornata]
MTPPQAEYEREPKTRRVTSQTRLGDPIDANKLSEVSIIEQENTKRMLAELTHNKEVRIEKETTKREEQRETTKREKLRLEYKTEKIGMTTKIPTQLSDPVEGSLGADESKVSSIEQEVTKRILAKLSHRKEVRIEKETTKREERREETKREQLRLEHEREISKRLELELQLQQSKYEHPRMEMERSQQSNTTLSLYSRRAGQQTDMTPVTDGMEGLSAQ